MSTCRGHADLTSGCTECALEDARAEVERLREALEQVLVDINDPHPRTSTLEGYRDALAATERMIQRVLDGGES